MVNHKEVRLAPGLYFVATPIGTARDITLRALDTLASADVLAAEDTRSLRKLMDIHGVPLNGRRVIAYHDHSGASPESRLLDALAEGRSVAYASEAGMPMIADPGFEVGRAAAVAGHPVTVVPGPSAVPTALAVSGLPTDAFLFGGFLPNAMAARRKRLEELKSVPATLVFFESPKRVAASLKDMAQVLGPGRSCALCRELTKKFEEVRRGTLDTVAQSVRDAPPKGEIVLVVGKGDSVKIRESDLEDLVREALKAHSVRDAADLVAQAQDVPRRKVYQLALKLSQDQ